MLTQLIFLKGTSYAALCVLLVWFHSRWGTQTELSTLPLAPNECKAEIDLRVLEEDFWCNDCVSVKLTFSPVFETLHLFAVKK